MPSHLPSLKNMWSMNQLPKPHDDGWTLGNGILWLPRLGIWGPYGQWGLGYAGGVAPPYDFTVTSLIGIAIRYTNNGYTKC